MEPRWLKYIVHVEPDREEEFVAAVLDSPYTLGWVEPQIEVLTTGNGYDYTENNSAPSIAYLFEPLEQTNEEHVHRLERYLAQWGGAVTFESVEEVAEENDSWKEEFREVQVGEWWVAPTWTEPEKLAAAQNVLWIDPGAAFGTGYHGTTQDLLLLLQQLPLAGKRVLDIGAGSGILSLFCVRNGAARPVFAVDINPQSEWQIEVNAANNKVTTDSLQIVIGDALDPAVRSQLPDQVEVVLLNIGGDEDVAMLPVVAERLADGGLVMLSGIVEWNREQVLAAYQQAGFHLLKERTSDEWVTMMMRYQRS
ncbi:50S ribosomal protein L11 methyltransferase [Brevibacillus sp. TJ4]|uniref:50S ribosomal protein L11 methyltransferase n=1 Tax=Brevibacillus sp. TJ4 TaxID=3234853 RepID=UPI0037D7DF1C